MQSPFDNPDAAKAMAEADVMHRPGMADQLMRELAPLLAAEDIDIENTDELDLATLQAALDRAVERRNLELSTPIGERRERACVVLLLAAGAIGDDEQLLAESLVWGVQPEPSDPDEPSVANVIGVALGELDGWFTDPELERGLIELRVPETLPGGVRAAIDILALARKGRAFGSIDALIRRHRGLKVLEGAALAVAAALMALAAKTHDTVTKVGVRLLIDS
ncbi:hypothetical protein [Agromyces aerolatus]|uniref:hypothetical protein n=1 Tax=Agromyces sp. LY-1074 TaxID=3074080 RepID=UPI00285E9740|nr:MULTISPECIES: hypothetical protein [unclassified Agromyces]MDR5699615.1 hypothetical protein [Agromyces sp. LY-1074]MDR5705911.1 hypothetical protein [Agromyces sp. LY-1358]